MRKVAKIIVHCSDSPNGRPDTIDDIDRWHKQRGFFRQDGPTDQSHPHVGYHAVIHLDGTVALGRTFAEMGAHALGNNHNSIGICMIGRDAFTVSQWAALKQTVLFLSHVHPEAEVIGHRDVSEKDCPGFDVDAWLSGGMFPLDGHVLDACAAP